MKSFLPAVAIAAALLFNNAAEAKHHHKHHHTHTREHKWTHTSTHIEPHTRIDTDTYFGKL